MLDYYSLCLWLMTTSIKDGDFSLFFYFLFLSMDQGSISSIMGQQVYFLLGLHFQLS